MTDLLIPLLAVVICTVVSVIWYFISGMMARQFPSKDDMTIPIFIIGMAAFTLVSIIAVVIMIVWWF